MIGGVAFVDLFWDGDVCGLSVFGGCRTTAQATLFLIYFLG